PPRSRVVVLLHRSAWERHRHAPRVGGPLAADGPDRDAQRPDRAAPRPSIRRARRLVAVSSRGLLTGVVRAAHAGLGPRLAAPRPLSVGGRSEPRSKPPLEPDRRPPTLPCRCGGIRSTRALG